MPASVGALEGLHVVIAELRGSFSYVLSSNAAWTVGCLYSAKVGEQITTSSFTELTGVPSLAGDDAVDVLQAGGWGKDGAGSAVLATGRAGSHVVGVDLITPGGQTVTASVVTGSWTAWWPATEPLDGTWTRTRVVVHLADGSTQEPGTLDSLTAVPSSAGSSPTPTPTGS